jgi:hypothetical protein
MPQKTEAQAERKRNGAELDVTLGGSLDEGADFERLIGPLEGVRVLRLRCKGVVRITSTCVRAWVTFFRKVTASGVKLELHECSPAIVDTMNLLADFLCGGTVESACLPFACVKCGAEFLQVAPRAELASLKVQGLLPEAKCPSCGKGGCVFDDHPQSYFRFLAFKS